MISHVNRRLCNCQKHGSAHFKFSIPFWAIEKQKAQKNACFYRNTSYCCITLVLVCRYDMRSLGCIREGRGGAFNTILPKQISSLVRFCLDPLILVCSRNVFALYDLVTIHCCYLLVHVCIHPPFVSMRKEFN